MSSKKRASEYTSRGGGDVSGKGASRGGGDVSGKGPSKS